jgi:predicted ester cyclase
MSMKGFDPKFEDFPAYILGVTHEIWEERRIDTLHEYYAPDIPVRTPSGVVVGNESVISATKATLAEFPDRQLLGEDVIWSGNEDEGFLSSHRILSTATHLGDGAFGPASGQRFVYRVIADCAAKDNTIYDEWLIRDQGAIVHQLGLDNRTFAADQITTEGGFESTNTPLSPDTDVEDVYEGKGNDDEYGQRYASILQSMMGGTEQVVTSEYDRAAHLEYPNGVTAHGWGAAENLWLGLRSAFPDAKFKIHHQIGRQDAGMPPRAALRWSLHGHHDGEGAYGPPTGANVYVMGLSHAEFGPYGLRREWVLFDDTAIWKQILIHLG